MSVSAVPMEQAWKEYYTYGGLPLVLTLDSDKKKADYLRNLYTTVYTADIFERQNIRNKSEFNELLSIAASSIGSPTNPRKLSNTFKSLKGKTLSSLTIGKYLDYLQDAFLLEKSIR
ncbi:MAG: ATP-binding protein, partial [Muribaculum sp.]|nr:ATP-binding protein [Muribaculum sp.]